MLVMSWADTEAGSVCQVAGAASTGVPAQRATGYIPTQSVGLRRAFHSLAVDFAHHNVE